MFADLQAPLTLTNVAATSTAGTAAVFLTVSAAAATVDITGGSFSGFAKGIHFPNAIDAATAVTLSDAALTNRPWSDAALYIVAQVAGGSVGVMVANLMFELDAITMSDKVRDGSGQYIAEVVATFGLIFLIFSLVRTGRESLAAGAVAAYIGGAYWFTSSTSFANPAVSVTRTLSNTFAGIDPASMPMFIVMQFIGATLAVAAIRVIYAND